MRVSFTVNGEPRKADDVWEGESLLYVLRERLGLPGSKNACEQGECGSCSVYLDGVLVCACLVLAGQAEGSEVVTVEGLASGDDLHPVQEAFVEAGAVQCGFCTPGLVVTTHDLLRRNPSPTDPEIREALAGNLCRCTGYEKILDAVRLASGRVGDDTGTGEGVWTTPSTPSDRGLPSRSGAPGPRDSGDARPGTSAHPGRDDAPPGTGGAGT
jgi:aerobic carbon-monoxide dehydrogenase small subunit